MQNDECGIRSGKRPAFYLCFCIPHSSFCISYLQYPHSLLDQSVTFAGISPAWPSR